MTDGVNDNKTPAQNRPLPQTETGSNKSQFLIIGLVVAALAALVGYQLLGCAECYGASWIR